MSLVDDLHHALTLLSYRYPEVEYFYTEEVILIHYPVM